MEAQLQTMCECMQFLASLTWIAFTFMVCNPDCGSDIATFRNTLIHVFQLSRAVSTCLPNKNYS